MAVDGTGRAVLEKLARWRTVLAGWHLGTAHKHQAGVQAMRDLREAVLLQRAELSAFAGLLLAKGVFTQAEFDAALTEEARLLDRVMEARFPGYRTTELGVSIDPALAVETNKRLGFPP